MVIGNSSRLSVRGWKGASVDEDVTPNANEKLMISLSSII